MTDQPSSPPSRPDQRQAAADRLARGRARERARLEEALADDRGDGIDWSTVRPDDEVDLGEGDWSRWTGPALALVALLGFAGLAWWLLARSSADDETPAAVAPVAAAETVTDSTPQPLDQPVQLGDWTITVTAWEADATAAVRARNPNNRDPDPGEVFGLAHIELARTGSEAADGFDLSFRLTDDAGVGYADYDSQCGVVPDGLDKFVALEPGDTIAGAVCFAFPLDKQGQLELVIGPAVDLDATAVTFDLP